MLDILRTYLQDTATPELTSALQDAHRLFDQIGLENYEPGFEELLMVHDEVDASETLITITNLTNQLQRRILAEHNVTLNEDIPTSVLNLFIQGLLDLQNYEDQTQLSMVTMMDVSDEEIFAEAIALVSPKSADELMEYIDNVGQFLITRLRELTYRESQVDTEQLDRVQKHITKLQKYLEVLGRTDLQIVQQLQSGMSVGYPFAVYASRDIEELPAAKAAAELVAIAFVSKEGVENPRAAIKDHIEQYVASIDKITQIDIEVNKLLLALERS